MDSNCVPGFTAETTLFKSANRYRSSGPPRDGASTAQAVMLALSDADRGRCDRCENKCNEQAAECTGYAAAGFAVGLVGCIAAGPFYPLCAGPVTAAYGIAIATCGVKHVACLAGECHAPGGSCCPVFCELGHCCSTGERCTNNGCCPSDRQICGGECCDPGYFCCNGQCCNEMCIDGVCTYPSFGAYTPVEREPARAPNPFTGGCEPGWTKCRDQCCPPGQKCCGYGCDYSCIN
jgi:hypothetical protein